MSWSKSDSYFVSGSLKVYSVDFSSEPLKLVLEENVEYDGPKGDDFKNLLLDNGFRVNREGKAIVRVPKRKDDEEHNVFLIEKVVPLGPYGFKNVPSPTQEVKVLKSLLDETRADLAKKNAMLDELHLKILDGNSGDLIRRKQETEYGATFLSAAKEILASIANTSTGAGCPGSKGNVCKPEDAKFPRLRYLKSGDFVEFFRRMNRTFVNEAGSYVKFDFIGTKFWGPRRYDDNIVRYYDKDWHMLDFFSMVQYDGSEPAIDLQQGTVSLPTELPPADAGPAAWIVDQYPDNECAFALNQLCFVGRITKVKDTFRNNAPLTVFFELSPHAKTCYVDAQASTFFVLSPTAKRFKNVKRELPKFLP